MDDSNAFVSPEGSYVLAEEHKPTIPVSVFATNTPNPSLVAAKSSHIVVHFAHLNKQSQSFSSLLSVGGKQDKKEKKQHQQHLPPVQDQDESHSSNGGDPQDDIPDLPPNPSPTEPPQHQQLFSPPPTVPKRKPTTRSKQNLKTTTSSFVTRYHAIEGLNKYLAAKSGDTSFMFYNSGKTFYMIETDTGLKTKEPLIRITFNAWPTCHAVNQSTVSSTSVDIVIGFHTGDLMWFDPLTTRYCRLNKQGCISNSPCTSVKWVPGSRNLFLASHANGTIVVYDKEREDDANFQPSLPPGAANATEDTILTPTQTTQFNHNPFRHLTHTQSSHHAHAPGQTAGTWNSLEDMWVTRPGSAEENEKEMALAATRNPVSHWRVSRKGVIDFAFSPDVRYVAVIAEDGKLRIIDALNETLIDTYAAYFGILTCLAWSPDGRFIAAGGQDDLITIYSPHDQRVIARCQGHQSFVANLAFDPLRCDGRTYRLISVGEDCKLILWDFSAGALHRPARLGAGRMSMSSQYSLALRTSLDFGAGAPELFPFGVGFGGTPRANASKYHPAPSRNEVAVVQPVVVKSMDSGGDILSYVAVTPSTIASCTRGGTVRLWTRPAPRTGGRKKRARAAENLTAVDDPVASPPELATPPEPIGVAM